MGIALTDGEMADFLLAGHTLILSTIRKSGEPFLVPVWYVWRDQAFHVLTFADSPKVGHLRNDPRACCMVEDGRTWIDLRAVVANCDAEIIEDAAIINDIDEANRRKYAAFRDTMANIPKASQEHYARARVVLKLSLRSGEVRSWYNRKLRIPPGTLQRSPGIDPETNQS